MPDSEITPKLKLEDNTDAQLIEYTDDKTAKINASAGLAAVDPSTAVVDAKNVLFRNALIAADNGTVAETALKDQYRAELELLLTHQAHDCAVIANGNLPLYLTSGYEAKDVFGTPIGTLPMVSDVSLDYGDSDGELKAGWKPLADASNFSVQVYSDVNNPSGSVIKEFIVPKIGKEKTVLDGLPSGKIVFVRVRANGGNTGHGAWSNVAMKRVP